AAVRLISQLPRADLLAPDRHLIPRTPRLGLAAAPIVFAIALALIPRAGGPEHGRHGGHGRSLHNARVCPGRNTGYACFISLFPGVVNLRFCAMPATDPSCAAATISRD